MSAFPTTRLRRLRRSGALRDLVRETTLSLDDLVQPLFVAPDALPNERLPALSRLSVDGAVRECEDLLRAGVKAVILFGIPEEKDDEGSGAWIETGIVQQALRALRPRFPELLLLTDVCLCEYTSHGHCGVLHGDQVDPDRQPRDGSSVGQAVLEQPADGRPEVGSLAVVEGLLGEPEVPPAAPANLDDDEERGGPGSTATRSSSWRPTWMFRARTVQPSSLRRAATSSSAVSPAT